MKRLIDLSGKRFGKLVVLGRAPNRKHSTMWFVRCDCGNEKSVAASKLRDGLRTSCEPCARAHIKYEWKITHGHTRGDRNTREYRAWLTMIGRCHRTSNASYAQYGGRGIAVCDEWRASFESFLGHVGQAPSEAHSIDRIDPNRHYEPGNVRWATLVEQANNRRNNVRITRNGVTKTAAQWSRELGDPRGRVVIKRLHDLGWSEADALDTPYVRRERRVKRAS